MVKISMYKNNKGGLLVIKKTTSGNLVGEVFNDGVESHAGRFHTDMFEDGVVAADLQRHRQGQQLGNGLHRKADVRISGFKQFAVLRMDAEADCLRAGFAELGDVGRDGAFAGNLFAP